MVVYFSAQMDDGMRAHPLCAMKGAPFEGAVPESASRGRSAQRSNNWFPTKMALKAQ